VPLTGNQLGSIAGISHDGRKLYIETLVSTSPVPITKIRTDPTALQLFAMPLVK
jgi:hypothetical protein